MKSWIKWLAALRGAGYGRRSSFHLLAWPEVSHAITLQMLILLLFASNGAVAGGNLRPGDMSATGQSSRQSKISQDKIAACNDISAEEATRLGLIRQMLGDGKPHAAIAHLDAAHIANPQADLLRADGLRQTGREVQAEAIYRRLLGSCVAGYAYQGLGLIASRSGNLQEAVAHLRAASAALPTEHTIRNDYGYVLMMSGDNKSAVHEFLTAVELAGGYRQAAHNLILLLYRDGENERADAFASQFGIAADELAKLQEMARRPLASADTNRNGTGGQ
ncbi:hypothetical protein MTYP_01684 [Methylophilaceae bacterium]|nr:hypothetical protein MTYP_01684 [Methylophilaceae bacterium]